MRILITGATGFIGFHLAKSLAAQDHAIVACARQADLWRERLPAWEWQACDFTRDVQVDVWAGRLRGVDLVINAVGIIGEQGRQTFRTVQTETPQALFSACSQAGVKVIQLSALGADARNVTTPFLRSKQLADDHLWQLPGECVVLYPSIVIGLGGNSTALFCRLAALPVVPLPGHGNQRINPIHIDDLCAAVAHLVAHWPGGKQRHWLTGVETLSVRELLMLLREWMELGKAHCLPVPLSLLSGGARVAENLAPAGLLRRDTLDMLANATTPPNSYAAIAPRPLREALWSRPAGVGLRRDAVAEGLRPLLVASLAFVWIFTGLVSVWWNVPGGYALLASAGITGSLAAFAIYSGGIADLVLGVLLLTGQHRRASCLLQIGLMVAYLLIASVIVPSLWLDPLGPLSKTLPLLVITAMLAFEAPAAKLTSEGR